MEMREFEGYEEAIKRILKAIPVELRLADIPPEELLAGLSLEERLAALSPEERLRALPVDCAAALPEGMRAEIERRLRP